MPHDPRRDPPLRFGIFLPPFHRPSQNPTLALRRDVELIERLDDLGYDEAWVGEHHSGGWENIASPELFLAHAAARTQRIKLGTGVISLPYHNPMMVADRMVLLDHLSRGRAMLGVGPGQLVSDAHMLGIDSAEQRRMMEESLDAIVALLRGEIVTRKTDWFNLQEARLQLRPFSDPCFEIAVAASFSPSGPRLAGKYGAGLLSIAATQEAGWDAVGYHWGVMEEVAAAHGATVDRRKWRLVGPMHIAESVEQAKKNLAYGYEATQRYLSHVLPLTMPIEGSIDDMIDGANATRVSCFGTPDMAIDQINRLWDASGGFGTYLFLSSEFADPEATLRNYELFAREVIPHFNGQAAPAMDSEAWLSGAGTTWIDRTQAAIGKAMNEYEAEKAARS